MEKLSIRNLFRKLLRNHPKDIQNIEGGKRKQKNLFFFNFKFFHCFLNMKKKINFKHFYIYTNQNFNRLSVILLDLIALSSSLHN